METLLSLGDEIWARLAGRGKLIEWLSVFDEANGENTALIMAIKQLDAPIATSNYDNLLEDLINLSPIILFVGFGKGVSDPNFKLLFERVSNYFPNTKM